MPGSERPGRLVGARRRLSTHRRGWRAGVGLAALLCAAALPLAVASGASLSAPQWSISATTAGATGVTYAYDFAAPTAGRATSVTMTVPAGTGGTPAVGSLGVNSGGNGTEEALTGVTVALDAGTLTVSFGQTPYLAANSLWWISITGLTNTSTPGSYASTITTYASSTPVDSASSAAVVLTASALTAPYWSASETNTSASAVAYSYAATTASSASLTSLAVSVPPGTSGSPSLSSVAPSDLAGGSLSLSGTTLTYTFASTSVQAGTVVAFSVGGLTNTPTPAPYGGEVVTYDGSTPVDSGALTTLNFTLGALGALAWSASSTAAGATGVAYAYTFTTATALSLSSIEMSVPPGTTGTPEIGAVSITPSYETFASPTVSLSSATSALTFAFTAHSYAAASVMSIQITGLDNTSTPGSYASSITTFTSVTYQLPTVDGGTAGSVAFSSTSLSSLSWSVSTSATSATDVAYTLSFALSSSASIDAISMSVPPLTGGSPTLVSASPPSISGGSVVLSGTTLTYAFSPATIASGSTVTVVVGGMTNTSTAAVYASAVTAYEGTTVLATGTTPSVTFTATVLTALSWGSDDTVAGDSGTTYTYDFTTSSGTSLSSVTLSVPLETAGTPSVSSLVAYSASEGKDLTLASPAVSLALSLATVSFTGVYVPSGTVFTIEIGGLTNTGNPGSYTCSITTLDGASAIDSGTTPSLSFSASALSSPTWSVSSSAVGATGTTYTYSFQVPADVTIDTVTMTIPSGTGGSPAVSSVSPGTLEGGTLGASATGYTYRLAAPVTLGANALVTIVVSDVTNPADAVSYASALAVSDLGTGVASGTTPSVTFTATVLGELSLSVSSTHTSAANVTYTWGFATASATSIDTVTMTVPSGTGGTPTVVSATPASVAGGSAALDGTTLTYSFASHYEASATAVTIAIGGLTNTAAPGSTSSAVTTKHSGASIDGGTTPPVTFVGGHLAGLGWSLSQHTASEDTTVTFSFTTASTSMLDTLTLTVPSGTSGTPAVSGASPDALAGGTAILVGQTLTYAFTPARLDAGTAISLTIGGLENTGTAGTYTSTIDTLDGGDTIDTGVTPSLWILPVPPALEFAAACPAPVGDCAPRAASPASLEILVIPGGPVASGSVLLSVESNLSAGYQVAAAVSTLESADARVLAEGPTGGSATVPTNALTGYADLAPSGDSGAALCPPWGSDLPYVGFGPIAASIWSASAETGSGSDAVTLRDSVTADITQPAGVYSGTISYAVATSGSC